MISRKNWWDSETAQKVLPFGTNPILVAQRVKKWERFEDDYSFLKMQKNQRWICFEMRIYQHTSHNIVLNDLVNHYGIFYQPSYEFPIESRFHNI